MNVSKKKPSTFLLIRVFFLGHTDEFERSRRFSSDFHETFVDMFNGSVKNDVSLERDSHILKAINTGEF